MTIIVSVGQGADILDRLAALGVRTAAAESAINGKAATAALQAEVDRSTGADVNHGTRLATIEALLPGKADVTALAGKADKTVATGSVDGLQSATDKIKLDGIAAQATKNLPDAELLKRNNQTGTQSTDTLTDGTASKVYTVRERDKLAAVALGATANLPNAMLLDRTNHTGTQPISSVAGLGPLQDQIKARVAAVEATIASAYKGDQGVKGDPGGDTMAVGPFAAVRAAGQGSSPMLIPAGTQAVRTSCHTIAGYGAAFYWRDASLTDAHLASFPRVTFRSRDETGAISRWRYYGADGWSFTAFGAVPDDTTDCYPCFVEMQAYNAMFPAVGSFFYGTSGQEVRLPAGPLYSSASWSLHARWDLIGAGAGGAGGVNTMLRFAADTRGIIVNRHNTDDDQVVASDPGKSADGSTIRRMYIKGGGGSTAKAFGVWLRARALLEDVIVDGFAGDNIHIVGNSGSPDSQLGTNYTAGNANDWVMTRVISGNCGGHGIWVEGIDANAGVASAVEVYGPAYSGIADVSYLGNYWMGVAVHGSNISYKGSVSHNGRRYDLIDRRDGIGGATEPGTDREVWENIGSGGAAAPGYPEWQAGGDYVIGCPIFVDNANASARFTAYVESGYPVVHVERSSKITGMLGGRVSRATIDESVGQGPTGTGAHISRGGYGSIYPIGEDDPLFAQYGPYVEAYFGGAMVAPGVEGTFLTVNSPRGTTLRGKLLGGGAGVAFNFGNLGVGDAVLLYDKPIPGQHGRPLGQRFYTGFGNGIALGKDANVHRILGQWIGKPPAGTDYAKGEFWLNSDPDGSKCAGYMCTTGAVVAGGSVTQQAIWMRAGALFLDLTNDYDPPALSPGASSPIQSVTIDGVADVDHVRVTCAGQQGIQIVAWAGNGEVRYYLHNPAGNPNATIDLGNTTFRIRVEKM